jgi:hypothetical protein
MSRELRERLSKPKSPKEKTCFNKKMSIVMNEFKNKTLRSSSGQRVTNPKQALAIALSVSKRQCLKNK